ncbi:hypothetical protein Salat_0186300 [Sesamum alatum]|uniref:Uncharacterized protein n=1 Tax=Sesamum alatum TaxID=300844 RepID=A0AAE1YYA9_9LAMI|nr:hypothetical protein Salat_0186300 [Sesamum alatum]
MSSNGYSNKKSPERIFRAMCPHVSSQGTVRRPVLSHLLSSYDDPDAREISFMPDLNSYILARNVMSSRSAGMANLYRPRRGSSTPSTSAPIPCGVSHNPALDPPPPVEISTGYDKAVLSESLKEALNTKIGKGKGKVDDVPVTGDNFSSIPTSQSSVSKKEVEKYEKTLRQMREKWIQSVSLGLEPLGSGPMLKLHWQAGVEQGIKDFYVTENCQLLVKHTRLEGARAFLESPVFYTIIDLKVFKELVSTWNKFLHQIHNLKAFKEGFDVSQLDFDKNELFRPYHDEHKVIDVPIDNEFYLLLPPEAMDPFIMASHLFPPTFHLQQWSLISPCYAR